MDLGASCLKRANWRYRVTVVRFTPNSAITDAVRCPASTAATIRSRSSTWYARMSPPSSCQRDDDSDAMFLQAARTGADRVEAWVEAMQDLVLEFSEEEKRLNDEAPDIRVQVYRQGHDPRVIGDGAVLLDDITLARDTCRRRCRC